MKAILVIDVKEDMIGEVDYTILTNGNMYYSGRAKLKPMPNGLDWKIINETTDEDSLEYGRCIGRQELIDEILGEEE